MLDFSHLISGAGTLGILIVALIIFSESAFLVGFFLPGDTLLFSAGLLASQGVFPIEPLILACILGAVIGDNVGYEIGHRTGPMIFKKEDGILFHKDNIIRAQKFYEKHGGKTVTIARFVPFIRTFAPLVAGIGKMDRKKFMVYNVVGGIVWCVSITLVGYWLGSRIPKLGEYIDLVLVGVIALSVVLSIGHILANPKSRKIILTRLKNLKKSS